MMRTAILLALAVLAVSTLAVPAQAKPEVVGSCVVEDDTGNRDYEVCVRTDGPCPAAVTFRGFFGQGSIPTCS